MLRNGLIMSLLLLLICSAYSQSTTGKATKAEQEVLAQTQAWCDAIVKGDVPTLEGILAADFIITAGDGSLRDKAAELKDLTPTADLKTLYFKTDGVRVRIYGNTAVVTGRAYWRINYKGREQDNERRFTSVFVKQNNRWQIVAQQMTRPPQRPPAN